ncbi:Oxygen-insensitive NAD(P)H nitroreductase [Indibacter alkaliphilus LW1]|uniref:Oxygen-insensitive NAD(P)H nitroreductase n=1 Tax=Indibacter alkaliphilus (strain CCUG 57479 / KCTC 22604 / LW1) TaxID=1189612 RepID=S2E2M2_INDAL|nr:NAD(P)H-dependent oxidoreductase [Indibacter alkaliphilus]EOZ98731.1 Oxygen-insensitive NAD(P)H nitroreductase [Indibacter alkaliphilus LW1]
MSQTIDSLNWRYATKRMTGKKINEVQLEQILDSIQLTATSNGLQPFSVLVVEDEQIKRKLAPAAFNQPQVVESSQVLVFAAWTEITEDRIDSYFEQVVKERNLDPSALSGYAERLKKHFGAMSKEEQFSWASKQAYIALGTAMVAAAEAKVDTTPMEGFDPAKVDEIFGLQAQKMGSTALLALGYRDENKDPMKDAKKVRRSKDKLFVKI